MPKTIGIKRKAIVHEVSRGDEYYLRKSADRKAQINTSSGWNQRHLADLCFAGIQTFSGSVYHLNQPHPQCFFLLFNSFFFLVLRPKIKEGFSFALPG